MSPESQAGLNFRQDLMKYMPQGIVAYDHAETVNAFAQGDVAMITEWSAFYSTVVSPETSKVAGMCRNRPRTQGSGGAQAGAWRLLAGGRIAGGRGQKQAAGWLFIQWLTSKEKAGQYLDMGGVRPASRPMPTRRLVAKFKFIPALVESWQEGVPGSVRALPNDGRRSPRSCRSGARR